MGPSAGNTSGSEIETRDLPASVLLVEASWLVWQLNFFWKKNIKLLMTRIEMMSEIVRVFMAKIF